MVDRNSFQHEDELNRQRALSDDEKNRLLRKAQPPKRRDPRLSDALDSVPACCPRFPECGCLAIKAMWEAVRIARGFEMHHEGSISPHMQVAAAIVHALEARAREMEAAEIRKAGL